MKKAKLQELINVLKAIGNPSAVVTRLIADLEDQYLANHDGMDGTYQAAWDQVVLARVDPMNQAVADAELTKFRYKWLDVAKYTSIRPIHFGQMRIAANFANAPNVNQQNLGVDALAGQTIQQVANQLTAGNLSRDFIPVQIFFHNNVWVSINNRGYACHCLAGVRPLRLFPRPASQDELNRLNDPSPVFTYGIGVAHLAVHPRVLPSPQIPITAGPNSFDVQAVANAVVT